MATRGYFKIVNGEGTTELRQVYQKTGDILVEAYHDGYLMEMLRDILVIPFQLAKMQSQNYGKQFVTTYFFPEAFYPKEWLEKYPERSAKNDDLDWVFGTNSAIGFYDLTWSDLLMLLQFTCFGKYMDIQSGVGRYGDEPVTFRDSYFTTRLDGTGRIDWLEISDIQFYDDDEPEEDDDGNVYLQSQHLQEMIDELNKHITLDEYKITYKDGVVRMSITGIVIVLMYNAAVSGNVIDPRKLAR